LGVELEEIGRHVGVAAVMVMIVHVVVCVVVRMVMELAVMMVIMIMGDRIGIMANGRSHSLRGTLSKEGQGVLKQRKRLIGNFQLGFLWGVPIYPLRNILMIRERGLGMKVWNYPRAARQGRKATII